VVGYGYFLAQLLRLDEELSGVTFFSSTDCSMGDKLVNQTPKDFALFSGTGVVGVQHVTKQDLVNFN
jgi:hypothetical protein